MKKIKKLMITAAKGGLRCVKPNDIEKQSITIKNNGQVWWNAIRTLTIEEQEKGFSNNGVKITEYKNIGRENAERILQRAAAFLKDRVNTEFNIFVCDAILDEIYIEYENGEILFGQLNEFAYQSDEISIFYDNLAEELLIESLFFFDD